MNWSLIIACGAVGLCIGLLITICKLLSRVSGIEKDLCYARSDINFLDTEVTGRLHLLEVMGSGHLSHQTAFARSLNDRVRELEHRFDVMDAIEVRQGRIDAIQKVINGDNAVSAEAIYAIAHGFGYKKEENEDEE